jgi:DNA-binding NarL/FixJ family response regulator
MRATSSRVLIIDDHARMRDGLRSLLAGNDRFRVVDAISDQEDVLDVLSAEKPDIVLFSLSLSRTKIETIARLKATSPEIKVVALTLIREDRYVHAALDAGADGYILKDENRSTLLSALGCVADGKQYLSPGLRVASMTKRK